MKIICIKNLIWKKRPNNTIFNFIKNFFHNIYTLFKPNEGMHWTEKAVLKKDSAHLSLPVIQVLCLQGGNYEWGYNY